MSASPPRLQNELHELVHSTSYQLGLEQGALSSDSSMAQGTAAVSSNGYSKVNGAGNTATDAVDGDPPHASNGNGYTVARASNGFDSGAIYQLVDVDTDQDVAQLTNVSGQSYKKYLGSPLLPTDAVSSSDNGYDALTRQQSEPNTPKQGIAVSQPMKRIKKVLPSATIFSSFQNLVKPFIGAGILALPHAFAEGGVLASAIIMVILGITVNYCIRRLLESADLVSGRHTFSTYATPAETPATGHTRTATANHTPSRSAHAYQRFDTETEDQYIINQNDQGPVADGEDDTLQHDIQPSLLHVDVEQHQQPPAATVNATKKTPTYRQIGYAAFGHSGTLMVDFCLCTSQIGFCIAYVSFISDNMSDLTAGIVNRVGWCLILLVVFSLMCQIRKMKTLSATSGFGNLTYAISLAIIAYDGFTQTAAWVNPSEVNYFSLRGLPFFFGTACFALEGAGLVLPVRATLKDPNQFSKLLNAGIVTVTVCYIMCAVWCYIFFGNATQSVITKNLQRGLLSSSVKIFLSISLLFSYAIQMFPVTEMCDHLFDKFVWKTAEQQKSRRTGETINQASYEMLHTPVNIQRIHVESNGQTSLQIHPATDSAPIAAPADVAMPQTWQQQHFNRRRITQIVARVLIVSFTVGLAIAFPDFGLIVSLIGSLSNSGIAFILPMLFYIKLSVWPRHYIQGTHNLSLKQLAQPYALPSLVLATGVVASVAGLTVTIQQMLGY